MPPTILRAGASFSALAATALLRHRLAQLDSDENLAYCTTTAVPLGVLTDDVDEGATAGIDLPMSGIQEITAAGIINRLAIVYPAADGKISATAVDGGKPYGIALQAAGANNDVIPVLPAPLLALLATEIPDATYVAPAGGATTDAEARAALALLAADVAAIRAALIASGVGVAE